MADFVQIRGLEGLRKKLKQIDDGIFSKALMTEIGLFAQTSIKTRTLQGEDANNAMFTPYTPEYAVFRKLKGHPVNKVDLTFEGDMLASMTFDADSDQVDIFFLNTEDKKGIKNPVKAFFLNKKRNFFALSEDDIKDINKLVKNYYHRLVEM